MTARTTPLRLKAQVECAYRLYTSGVSITSLAEATGFSTTEVRALLRKHRNLAHASNLPDQYPNKTPITM